MMKKIICALCLLSAHLAYGKVYIKDKTPQTIYASSLLNGKEGKLNVYIELTGTGEAEGFTLLHKGKKVRVMGNDGAGAIYGVNKLLELLRDDPELKRLNTLSEAPQMKLRGACVGLQKTVYLPGHRVYEYPYTPENFPWFYDKALWLKYLDLLAENNMNTVYLWNGHPFASLVKLKDYPFAPEVDDATMQKNQEMFGFLVDEADRRGIRVIQMFYNIILSKPFADHYGLKTQDRNRPITPLIADYTRQSIAAFVEKYPKVGFLICLGEAMSGIENDIKWMTETIIPGIQDGLKRREERGERREDTPLPPIILRNHDTDGPAVLKATLPLYPNIYTMNKYTGESLTTYEPGGPWGETHRMLAAAAPIHIDNVHILANLEPWRWSSPAFTQKAVQAMHQIHHSKGLHLYPQASYWDWPYTADKLPNGERLLQIDRDWMWYKAWGRYAWNCERGEDNEYWLKTIMDYYGIKDRYTGQLVLDAYNESGEIAPKLLRRFGITEGNRQTLLLGMKIAQLVNPYKYTIYPGFYESCGPKGEKLIEYVEKEWKGDLHEGELPTDIVEQCVEHGNQAARNVIFAVQNVEKHQEEFLRFANDMFCYWKFAASFRAKVLAAQQVLNYKWTKDIKYLDNAVPLLEQSVHLWQELVSFADSHYLYANSMQTAQRRIPVGGDDGKMKTWSELAVVYQEELDALKSNIEKLKHPTAPSDVKIRPATPAKVTIHSPLSTLLSPLEKGAVLFENREDTKVDSLAPELVQLQALVLNRDTTRIVGTSVEFTSDRPVKMLVGFFQDDDPKWAKVPKLEIDATGNEYGQAEPILTNAITLQQMPPVNIHAYHFPAGHHTINLPKGIIMVIGFTSDDIRPRDVGLQGASDEIDWLFMR